MVPVVSMEVAPVITEVPDIVPLFRTDAVIVLLLRFCTPTSVITTPDVGNTAVPETPVPPRLVSKDPVTAVGCDKSIALKYGAPPLLGTVKL